MHFYFYLDIYLFDADILPLEELKYCKILTSQ